MTAGRSPGVRLRITLAVGVAFAVALTCAAAFLVARQRIALTNDLETTARLRADDLVAALNSGSLPSSIAIPLEDGSFVQIVDSAGSVVRSSHNIQGEARVAAFSGGAAHATARTMRHLPIGDTPFRVVAEISQGKGTDFTVYVGTSLEPVERAVHDLLAALALGAPGLIAIVVGLTWLAVGRALRPVEQIRSEVASITERDLHRRVHEPATTDEIGQLAKTMNMMLGRLEDAADRRRRFVADASHELRSPLAAMRAQLEVNLAHPRDADWQPTQEAVLSDTLRMQRLVDDLLDLADLDRPASPVRRETLDIDEIVLAEARRISTRGKVLVEAREVGAVQAVGDRDSLTRAVRNLLDNAERHARRTVNIAVTDHGATLQIRVSDDGDGVTEADRERIFERFARADPSRASQEGGHGLGLAIARDIVNAHGGSLTLEGTGRTGVFVIELPHRTDGLVA